MLPALTEMHQRSDGQIHNRNVKNREIHIADIDMDKVNKNMFVCFYTGFIEKEGYGTKKYFTEHPELSTELLKALLQKNVSMIGVDFAGVRRGKEHTPYGSVLCRSWDFYYRKFVQSLQYIKNQEHIYC